MHAVKEAGGPLLHVLVTIHRPVVKIDHFVRSIIPRSRMLHLQERHFGPLLRRDTPKQEQNCNSAEPPRGSFVAGTDRDDIARP